MWGSISEKLRNNLRGKDMSTKVYIQNEVSGSVILKQSGKIDENTVRVEYVLKMQIN